MNKVNRNTEMDIAKGIGIMLMVIGHIGVRYSSLIYLFHMPLFFIISGYFYNSYYDKRPIEFLKRKLKTLYIPYIKINIIFCVLHNFFIRYYLYITDKEIILLNNNDIINNVYMTKYSLNDLIFNIIRTILFMSNEQLSSATWFLRVLFINSILFSIIGYYCLKIPYKNKNILKLIICLTLFIIGFIFQVNEFNPIQIPVSFSTLILFYIGYIIKEKQWIKFLINKYNIIIYIIVLLIMNKIGSVSLEVNKYTNPIFLLITSLSGFIIIMNIAKYISKVQKLMIIITYMGKNTIPILGFHFLAFKIITLVQIIILRKPLYYLAAYPVLDSNGAWAILYLIVGVSLPLLFNYICIKIKKLYKQKILKAENNYNLKGNKNDKREL